MIQRIAYFDTFDEPFDNYFRVMRGAAVSLKKKMDFEIDRLMKTKNPFALSLDPGEILRLYIAN
jgi:hypothetical protein